ncbi:hypothetical protein [Streptomyces sp. N2A]|uniref:hypothetical protein n=1 Tax=Streptomyces sp. N2A TaxID=3073936 RepID=UPI00286FD60E|nr:hypothetical protein [Streptomyces sp. N2A]
MTRTTTAGTPRAAKTSGGFAGGCLAVGLLLLSALLILVSFAATTEIDSPEAFPGIKDNRSGLVLVILILGVAALLGAAATALRVSRRALPTAAVSLACALLLAAAGCRAYTLAPMLKCWGHESLAHNPDDSYTCHDRRI